jgi:hypothetical protein
MWWTKWHKLFSKYISFSSIIFPSVIHSHTLFIYHHYRTIFAVDSSMNTVGPFCCQKPCYSMIAEAHLAFLSRTHICNSLCHVQDCCVAELHTENVPCNRTDCVTRLKSESFWCASIVASLFIFVPYLLYFLFVHVPLPSSFIQELVTSFFWVVYTETI